MEYVSKDSNSQSENSPNDFKPKTESLRKKTKQNTVTNFKKFIKGYVTGERFKIFEG